MTPSWRCLYDLEGYILRGEKGTGVFFLGRKGDGRVFLDSQSA